MVVGRNLPIIRPDLLKAENKYFSTFSNINVLQKKVTQNAGSPRMLSVPECSMSWNARNHNSKFEFVLGPLGPERACCYVRVIQVSQLISSDHASITYSNENSVSGHDLLVSGLPLQFEGEKVR